MMIPSKIGVMWSGCCGEVSIVIVCLLGWPQAGLWTFLCDGKRDTNLVIWHSGWLSVLEVPLDGIGCVCGWLLEIPLSPP